MCASSLTTASWTRPARPSTSTAPAFSRRASCSKQTSPSSPCPSRRITRGCGSGKKIPSSGGLIMGTPTTRLRRSGSSRTTGTRWTCRSSSTFAASKPSTSISTASRTRSRSTTHGPRRPTTLLPFPLAPALRLLRRPDGILVSIDRFGRRPARPHEPGSRFPRLDGHRLQVPGVRLGGPAHPDRVPSSRRGPRRQQQHELAQARHSRARRPPQGHLAPRQARRPDRRSRRARLLRLRAAGRRLCAERLGGKRAQLPAARVQGLDGPPPLCLARR